MSPFVRISSTNHPPFLAIPLDKTETIIYNWLPGRALIISKRRIARPPVLIRALPIPVGDLPYLLGKLL